MGVVLEEKLNVLKTVFDNERFVLLDACSLQSVGGSLIEILYDSRFFYQLKNVDFERYVSDSLTALSFKDLPCYMIEPVFSEFSYFVDALKETISGKSRLSDKSRSSSGKMRKLVDAPRVEIDELVRGYLEDILWNYVQAENSLKRRVLSCDSLDGFDKWFSLVCFLSDSLGCKRSYGGVKVKESGSELVTSRVDEQLVSFAFVRAFEYREGAAVLSNDVDVYRLSTAVYASLKGYCLEKSSCLSGLFSESPVKFYFAGIDVPTVEPSKFEGEFVEGFANVLRMPVSDLKLKLRSSFDFFDKIY